MACPIINRIAKVSKEASGQAEVELVQNLIYLESVAQEETTNSPFLTYNRTKLSVQ